MERQILGLFDLEKFSSPAEQFFDGELNILHFLLIYYSFILQGSVFIYHTVGRKATISGKGKIYFT